MNEREIVAVVQYPALGLVEVVLACGHRAEIPVTAHAFERIESFYVLGDRLTCRACADFECRPVVRPSGW